MRKFMFFILLFCLAGAAAAQAFLPSISAPFARLTAYSTAHADALSCSANAAALSSIRQASAGVYGERRFLLSDLGSYILSAALPLHWGSFGLMASYAGSALYNESGLGLGYARRLGRLDAGLRFHYASLKASGYGQAASVNAGAALLMHVTDRFTTGMQVNDAAGLVFGKEDGSQPLSCSLGAGYDASESFFIGMEISKTEGRPVTVEAGLEYSFAGRLFARAGVSSASSMFCLGAGFLWEAFRIDATASLHPNLGISPGITIIFNRQKK